MRTLRSMLRYCYDYGDAIVSVDLTGQVLHADTEDPPSWAPETKPTLHRSVKDAEVTATFTPHFALAAKAKAFDARLEHLVHRGTDSRMGLYAWVGRVAEGLEAGTPARGLLDAARHLAGAPLAPHGPSRLQAVRWLSPFNKDPGLSKPIGFYAGTESLEEIFAHDRLLQVKLPSPERDSLRSVLSGDPVLEQFYESHMALLARLTGPFPTRPRARRPLTDDDGEAWAVLPPSDAAENRLIHEAFGLTTPPDGFELGAELARRIRDGSLATAPRPEDGWYAHQFHATAALLDPATEGLSVGTKYREDLEATFLALFTMNRETHIKQLEMGVATGAPQLEVAPHLSVEPLPEHYARVAAGYEFLRDTLDEHLGRHVLESTRLDEGGPSVRAGLMEMAALFRGAEATAYGELGRPQEDTVERELARSWFATWQARSASDPDLAIDARIAVPVYFDAERERYRLTATVGLQRKLLRVMFLERPRVAVRDAAGATWEPSSTQYKRSYYSVFSPVTIEADVRVPPSRRQFRALCDKHESPEAIKEALEGAR